MTKLKNKWKILYIWVALCKLGWEMREKGIIKKINYIDIDIYRYIIRAKLITRKEVFLLQKIL